MADETDKGDAAGRQDQLDDREILNGLAAAFERVREMGPQVLILQAALLEGVVLGQRREADRLEARDPTDPRRGDADARAERAETLRQEAERGSQAAGRLIGGLQQQGLFHGYITDAGGAPAVGYLVQVVSAAGAPLPVGREPARTAEDGYFRFEAAAQSKPDSTAPGRQPLAEVAERLAGVQPPPAPAADTAEHPPTITVQVLDPSGRVVFTDPSPPDFANGNSAFRFYFVPTPLQAGDSGNFTTGRAKNP